MKEIRLHGRGGQGVVKASQIIVKAAVSGGIYGQFIPFFGVERKGSPVFGYLRLSEEPIRRKMQIYEPDALIIMDDSLIPLPATYDGLKENGVVMINTTKALEDLRLPKSAASVATVDASGISEDLIGRNIPNTAMLGAFCKVYGEQIGIDRDLLFGEIEAAFGEKNRLAAEKAYNTVNITEICY